MFDFLNLRLACYSQRIRTYKRPLKYITEPVNKTGNLIWFIIKGD